MSARHHIKTLGLHLLLVVILWGAVGCTKHLGQHPCSAGECYGQDIWQNAIDKIAKQNFPDKKYTGVVFLDPLNNAWTTQGKQVNISQDLLIALMRSGNTHVLSVAAHEMAHIRLNHYARQEEISSVSLLQKHLPVAGKSARGMSEDEAAAYLSRQHELEADALAVQYLNNMGYPKNVYLGFLNWIKNNLKDAPPTSLATHPPIRERMARIENLN